MLTTTVSRLGLRISRVFAASAPDPFVLAVLLTIAVAMVALLVGDFEGAGAGIGAEPGTPRPTLLLDAWRGDAGLWKFLAFSMQMCLILVTGHALASSKPVSRAVASLAALPKNGAQAAAMVGLVAASAGLVNWGLGLIVGALLARDVGRSLARRDIPAHYPLIVAAGYMGMMVWHGGFSGSAPLSVTGKEQAQMVFPASDLVTLESIGWIPLSQTLLSPLNLFVTGGLLLLIPVVLWVLTPHDPEQCRTYDDVAELLVGEASVRTTAIKNVPEWLERTPPLAWLLAIFLVIGLVRFGGDKGFNSLGLNEVNAAMLALGLIMHGSLASYAKAVEDGAKGCAGIIVQFPLYAGILAMLSLSGLIARFSGGLALGGETGVPLFSFLSAGIVNFFVPSGGGQWGIQGPIALQAGLDAGVAPGKMVMAVAYGDQLTNMLQPFWALPLLAITGVKARDIVGYTAIVMLAAVAWVTVGLLVF
ncbi:MAG: short-chain fatty acids transporter [Phycisphaerales bacterium]|jgi:short-chain fatty acids transporter